MERRNFKDVKKRQAFASVEHTRKVFRALLKDRSLPQQLRFQMSVE